MDFDVWILGSCELQGNIYWPSMVTRPQEKQHDLENPLSRSSQDNICLSYHAVHPSLVEHLSCSVSLVTFFSARSAQRSENQQHLLFVDIQVNTKYRLLSHFRGSTGGGFFDRRQVLLWLSCPPPPLSLSAKPQSASFSRSPGPRWVSRPGCKGYGLWLDVAQMNWIPGSMACHTEEQWDVKASKPWMTRGGERRKTIHPRDCVLKEDGWGEDSISLQKPLRAKLFSFFYSFDLKEIFCLLWILFHICECLNR